MKKKLSIIALCFLAISCKAQKTEIELSKQDSIDLIKKGWIVPSKFNFKIPVDRKVFLLSQKEASSIINAISTSDLPSKDGLALIQTINLFYNDTTIKVLYK